ncbi:MAG TPA: hypothetical protein VMB48_16805 [Steroidobacteraceae bacterium]|nr:hypothetical protein [Steroidobacteraceae bacterium]
MRHRLIGAAIVGALLALPAFADCDLPAPPSKIPDGSVASEQEMISAMNTLKQYNGDVDVYLKCLEFEERQNRLSPTDHEREHNNAVSVLQAIAAKFNEQVRIFKQKHS